MQTKTATEVETLKPTPEEAGAAQTGRMVLELIEACVVKLESSRFAPVIDFDLYAQ